MLISWLQDVALGSALEVSVMVALSDFNDGYQSGYSDGHADGVVDGSGCELAETLDLLVIVFWCGVVALVAFALGVCVGLAV